MSYLPAVKLYVRLFAFFTMMLTIQAGHTPSLADTTRQNQETAISFSKEFHWFDYLDPPLIVPELKIKDREDQMTSLQSYAGDYILLNLWATWCAPCIIELPSLRDLQSREDKIHPHFSVVTISVDRAMTGQRMQSFLEKKALADLQSYYDPERKVAGLLAASALPTTYLIDRDGRVRFKMVGHVDWSEDRAAIFLKTIIARLDQQDK